MNTIGKLALQDIRSLLPEFSNAIIAGGFCRDYSMGGEFTDIDFYIPFNELYTGTVHNKIISALKNHPSGRFTSPSTHKGKYKTSSSDLSLKNLTRPREIVTVLEATYLGSIPIDIVLFNTKIANDIQKNISKDNFGLQVVNSFNFGIDQFWYDGEKVFRTGLAHSDMIFGTATLCKYDANQGLDGAFNKFLRLKEKYKSLRFTSNLEIKEKEPFDNQFKEVNTDFSF